MPTTIKITELTELTTPHSNTLNTVFVVVDKSSGIFTTKQLSLANLDIAIDNVASFAFNTANLAFSKANTANVTAEASFSKANTANITAEAAFSKANTANITGEAAFSKANTANITGEAAFSKANTANITGEAAFSKANTVNVTAEAAFSKANIANVTAEASFSKANTANVTGEAAFSKANTAHIAAEAAFSKANTANITAEAAFSKANTVNVTAEAAFSKANTANVTGEAAFVKANSAFNQANTVHLPSVTRLSVTNSGSSAYLIDQYAGNNPTIHISAGETIAFNLDVTGHPFMIRVASSSTNYSNGLIHVSTSGIVSTNSSAQGQVTGTLYWKVPFELTGNNYVYQCSVHAGMVGTISIGQSVNLLNVSSNIIPSVGNTYQLGTLSNPWKHLYVSGGTIFIDGVAITLGSGNSLVLSSNTINLSGALISVTASGNVSVPGVTETRFKPASIIDYRGAQPFFNSLPVSNTSVIVDQATHLWAVSGGGSDTNFTPSVYSAIFDSLGFITSISINTANYYGFAQDYVVLNTDNMRAYPPGTTLTVASLVANAINSIVLAAGVDSTSESVHRTTPVSNIRLSSPMLGGRAFANNSNVVAEGNFGARLYGGGSNTVPVWSDGTNWYIG